MHENEIGTLILDAAFQVHKELGPGLLESTYETCISYEASQMGLLIETQLPLPVIYKEVKLDCGYRIDIRAEKKVIVEIKAVEKLNDVHLAQLLTYMKLSGCKLGYLINFNVKFLKEGIKRVVLGDLSS
ncbi:MAG: GxxExxY protein [Chitinophagaceae bacterium]|nr:GxxExxY protein [Chitinophagaceae bacterium]MBL0068986.1 GxxExxY protein [Chitinophagaceae bacterium]